MASEEIAVLLKQAAAAQQAGDTATAIACLQKIVTRDPGHEVAWAWLDQLLTVGTPQPPQPAQPPPERSAAETAARAHLARADRAGSLGRFVEAIEEYRLAVTLDPSLANAWYAMGVACQQLGWSEEAAQAYRRTLAVAPQHTLAEQSLQRLQAPLSRAGLVLWSSDLTENEAGNFGISADGQTILVASGGVGALMPEATGRPSGRIHLVDRCGDVQTIMTDWKIWQAGLSSDGGLVYAGQAVRDNALVTWLDPADVSMPVMQHRLQGGPPTIWKCPNDLLMVASRTDPVMAIELDGHIVWQVPHEQCDAVRFQPSADGQALLVVTETLQAFTTSVQVYLVTLQGQLLWYRTCSGWLSSTILDTGLRVLITGHRAVEVVNQQGATIWKKAYKEVTLTCLSPTQHVVVVQYEHANALEALDTWGGRVLWQRRNLLVNSLEFAALDQTTLLVLRGAVLEALDVNHGNTLWQVNLESYSRETGRVINTGEDWVAVLLGQMLVTVDKNGQVMGSMRFSSSDLGAWAIPHSATASQSGRGLLVAEAGRRLVFLDRAARPLWTQTVPCRDWLSVPHRPYLVALGPKTSDRYTLTMIRC